MTRMFTAAEMLAEAEIMEAFAAGLADEDAPELAEKRRRTAAMLRQAAAEGKWEAQWKALAAQAANAMLSRVPAVESWGTGTLEAMKRIEEGPIRATPTEPTRPPAAAGPKRCGTCKHFGSSDSSAWCEVRVSGRRMRRFEPVPADGSGFCHLWEAKP